MKIKIDNSTYIVMLFAFLSGYFEYIYLLLITIFIHELGHYLFGYLAHFKKKSIIIYPFGGITIYNEDLNVSTNKELFVLLGGIIFQLLFYFFIYLLHNELFITDHVFYLFKRINTILISFNFLPILPLDGGRLLNIITDKLLPYRVSNKLCIIISMIFTIYFLFRVRTILSIILVVFLIKSIIIEIKNLDYKYNQFLLERYLKDYNFKHIRFINNKNYFKRDNYHFINNEDEKKYLNRLFN